jgi:hypothetical protein
VDFQSNLHAQEKPDTTHQAKWVQKLEANKNVKKLLGFISREPEADLSPFLVKSEDSYLKYDGKIIRKIIIRRIGFEKIVVDSARNIQNFISNAANKLHRNSRESIIRNNIFVRTGAPLNAYRLADNERLLRNLNFIMDSRIYVKPLLNNLDSVDLIVVTRDVFSLSGDFEPNFPTKYKFTIQDINFLGLGQTIQLGQVFDLNRNPHYGYQSFYQLVNMGGSFIDASVGYTNLDNGVSVGNENESSFYFRLNRSLYQPFTRFAGTIELSDNVSQNVYHKPDSIFARYHYRLQDYWLGYSFGYRKLPNNLKENRNRKFIALRGFEQNFLSAVNTELTEPDRFAYRDKAAILAQLTFFRQDFYKTQFVVGFGRTEDIPYGYRLAFTYGWEKELGVKRPYIGSELLYSKFRPSGTILTYNVRTGTYWNKNLEDGLFSVGFSRYSRIYKVGKSIVRHQTSLGYAALVNQAVKRGIDIRDVNGILGFRPDSLVGFQRVTLSQETTIFTRFKFLGFRIAPVVRMDLVLLRINPGLFQSRNFFSGFSFGLRARNENLIFNTVEARLFYYPKTVERITHFGFNITTNFRIKYPTDLVSKPATVFP